MSDKSNARSPRHRIWQEMFTAVADEYPRIAAEHRYIDTLALELVCGSHERFEVIVTNNLFGDILSDLGAGLVGGLGVAASANLHPDAAADCSSRCHGSAPRTFAGKGVANPDRRGADRRAHGRAARDTPRPRAISNAPSHRAVADGARTPDLGGRSTTREVAAAIAARL